MASTRENVLFFRRKPATDEHLVEEKPVVGCYFITLSIFRTDTLAPKPDCILAGRVTLRTAFYIFPLLRRQPSLHSLPWKSVVEHAQKTEMSVPSTLFEEQTPRYRLYTQLFKRGYTRFLQRSGFASKDLASCNEGLIFLFQFLPFLSFFSSFLFAIPHISDGKSAFRL